MVSAVDVDALFECADEARRQSRMDEGNDNLNDMDEDDEAFKRMFANVRGRLRTGKPVCIDMPDGDVHVCYGTQCPHAEVTREKQICLLYTSPSPRDRSLSRMPSSA